MAKMSKEWEDNVATTKKSKEPTTKEFISKKTKKPQYKEAKETMTKKVKEHITKEPTTKKNKEIKEPMTKKYNNPNTNEAKQRSTNNLWPGQGHGTMQDQEDHGATDQGGMILESITIHKNEGNGVFVQHWHQPVLTYD